MFCHGGLGVMYNTLISKVKFHSIHEARIYVMDLWAFLLKAVTIPRINHLSSDLTIK